MLVGRFEQLVLIWRIHSAGLRFLLITRDQEPIRFAPAIRLIPEFALPIGVGPWRPLPICRLHLLHQSRRLAGHDNEPAFHTLVRFHRVPAVETRIGARQQRLHHLRHGGKHHLQMCRDLFARRRVAVAQFPRHVFLGLGQKCQNRLKAFLAFVLRVIPLYGLPSGRPTACAPSCRYPEPRRSISRWLLPILAVTCTAAPPSVGRPRRRTERPGTARRYTAAGAATRPRFPSAWARAAETACDSVARNPRSRPAPSQNELIRRHGPGLPFDF